MRRQHFHVQQCKSINELKTFKIQYALGRLWFSLKYITEVSRLYSNRLGGGLTFERAQLIGRTAPLPRDQRSSAL